MVFLPVDVYIEDELSYQCENAFQQPNAFTFENYHTFNLNSNTLRIRRKVTMAPWKRPGYIKTEEDLRRIKLAVEKRQRKFLKNEHK